MNALRKKMALWACLILGPLLFLAGFVSTYKDIVYMTQSVMVQGSITGEKEVQASKGPDQIRFTVKFTTPAGIQSEAFLTVYDFQRNDFLSRNPLMLRYLASDPDSLRPEDFFPQGWIPIPIGAAMFIVGLWVYRKKQAKEDYFSIDSP